MSQRTVQLIIGRILTDEVFRGHFVQEPAETLTGLRDQGFELTALEAEALLTTDRKAWDAMAQLVDSRLQRCRLAGSCE